MILYFSATGNSRHVAEKIALATGDSFVSIQEIKENTLNLMEETQLGIVCPVYWWQLPSIVKDFLSSRKIKVSADCYVFFVATYGTTCGAAGMMMRHYLGWQDIKLDGAFSVRMPDTWTPIFNLSDKAKVAGIVARAEKEIERTSEKIAARKHCFWMRRQTPSFVLAFTPAFYDIERQTNRFSVDASCIGCGLCARKCPVDAIRIVNFKPEWTVDKCAMCLGCLHRCPKFSIQYGNGKTRDHGQYIYPGKK